MDSHQAFKRDKIKKEEEKKKGKRKKEQGKDWSGQLVLPLGLGGLELGQ